MHCSEMADAAPAPGQAALTVTPQRPYCTLPAADNRASAVRSGAGRPAPGRPAAEPGERRTGHRPAARTAFEGPP